MSEPIRNQLRTERAKQVFSVLAVGARRSFGKRPVLRVIEVNYNFYGYWPNAARSRQSDRHRNAV